MSGYLKPLIAHIPEESFIKVIYKSKVYTGIILNIENGIPNILSLIDTDTDKILIISNDNRIDKNNELFINDYQVPTFGPGINAAITTLLKKWAQYAESVEFTAPKGIPPLKDLTEKKGDNEMENIEMGIAKSISISQRDINSKADETKDDGLFKVKIKININKNFESTVEGFMAYYGFIKSDKESESHSIYTWTRVSTDIYEVRQMLIDQLGAIIQGKCHPIGAFISLAINAVSALPNIDEIENDYFYTIGDGLGAASLRISITKDSDDL